jgi:hypothetical protein
MTEQEQLLKEMFQLLMDIENSDNKDNKEILKNFLQLKTEYFKGLEKEM